MLRWLAAKFKTYEMKLDTMETKNSVWKAPKFPHRAKNSHANARFTPFIKYALRGFTKATRENFTDDNSAITFFIFWNKC